MSGGGSHCVSRELWVSMLPLSAFMSGREILRNMGQIEINTLRRIASSMGVVEAIRDVAKNERCSTEGAKSLGRIKTAIKYTAIAVSSYLWLW